MPKGIKGFQKGRPSWNKGTKGLMSVPWCKGTHIQTNTGRTHFKKGHISCFRGKKRGPLSEEHKRKIGFASKGNTYRKGIKHTEEHKKRISEMHKKSGVGKWMKDRRLPESTLAKMRQRKGPKANNWQGGIYPLVKHIRKLFKYRQWRSDIFQRDDYTCQNCNVKGGILHAHHIKSFSSILKEFNIKTIQEALDCEALWNINNGITFCKKCHRLEKEIMNIEKEVQS